VDRSFFFGQYCKNSFTSHRVSLIVKLTNTKQEVQEMNINELTKMVEKATGCQVDWDLGKKYIATNKETGAVVAEYRPRSGKLIIKGG